MNRTLQHLLLLFFLLAGLTSAARAQTAPTGAAETKWIRVASDNGEISFDFPAEYGFFADRDGFTVSERSNDYAVREMRMLTAFGEKTMFAVESYRAVESALDAIRERENARAKAKTVTAGGVKVKQYVTATDDYYSVKRYFSSKNHVYIVTAAARAGETAAMKRFLDSFVFDADGTSAPAGAVAFSNLNGTPIDIETGRAPDAPKNPPADKNDGKKNLVIVSKAPAFYTSAARQGMESGTIQMRLTFAKEGRVSKIVLLRALDRGLLRQSVFAAIRIKFLPQELKDEPETVTKTIEYSFDIY